MAQNHRPQSCRHCANNATLLHGDRRGFFEVAFVTPELYQTRAYDIALTFAVPK